MLYYNLNRCSREKSFLLGIVLMFSNRVHLVSLPTPFLTWLVLIIIQEPSNLRPIYIPSLWRCQPCTHMPAIQQLRAPLCVWWMELNKTGGLPCNKPYKPPLRRVALALSTNIKTSFHPHAIDKLSRKPHNKEQLLRKIRLQVFDPFPISSPCLTKWGFRCDKYS